MIWRYVITALVSALIGSAVTAYVCSKDSWRLFVLHNSEKVTIKVK